VGLAIIFELRKTKIIIELRPGGPQLCCGQAGDYLKKDSDLNLWNSQKGNRLGD